MAGEKFIKIIQETARGAIPKEDLSNILFGTVTSISPLKILIENKYEIGDDFLVLSPFCIEFKSKNGDILWNGLKQDDKVNLLRFDNGQKFYVLDKGGK